MLFTQSEWSALIPFVVSFHHWQQLQTLKLSKVCQVVIHSITQVGDTRIQSKKTASELAMRCHTVNSYWHQLSVIEQDRKFWCTEVQKLAGGLCCFNRETLSLEGLTTTQVLSWRRRMEQECSSIMTPSIQQMKKPSSLLPLDTWRIIFSFLPRNDLLHVLHTCKVFLEIGMKCFTTLKENTDRNLEAKCNDLKSLLQKGRQMIITGMTFLNRCSSS